MKIHIHAPGESSVGIPDYNDTIEIEWPHMDGDAEERARVRDIFKVAFGELVDDRVDVQFDDECGTCGQIEGHRKGCYESPEFEEEMRRACVDDPNDTGRERE